MASLRFEIQGELGQLTLRALQEAIDLNLRMLSDYDRGVSKQRQSTLSWVINNVETGSIVFDLQSHSRLATLDVGMAVAREWQDGWRRIEKEGKTPPYLTWNTMQKARQVTRGIGREGVYGFVAATMDERTEVTARASANMEQLVTERHHSIGSVEGTLETVSIHGAKRFIVYHGRTNKAVRCTFNDDEWIKRAVEAMGRRVVVMGEVATNAKGEPLRVDVQRLRILRDRSDLPTTAELTGVDPDFTGGRSTEDYLRLVRGA